jgi:hypothetical protein
MTLRLIFSALVRSIQLQDVKKKIEILFMSCYEIAEQKLGPKTTKQIVKIIQLVKEDS